MENVISGNNEEMKRFYVICAKCGRKRPVTFKRIKIRTIYGGYMINYQGRNPLNESVNMNVAVCFDTSTNHFSGCGNNIFHIEQSDLEEILATIV